MEKELAIDGNTPLIEAIEAARDGEEIVLTHDGHRVGRLRAETATVDSAAASAAFQRILERSQRMRLDGLSLIDLKHEGHRH